MESYSFEHHVLTIIDPELGISIKDHFDPIKISFPIKGQNLKDGHILRAEQQDDGTLQEAYIEKQGIINGQYLAFYSSGKVKMEMYYKSGVLHGPSIFYDPEGIILAKSWFFNGQRQGKSHWFYSSGALYSQQSFVDGVWHGQQNYYYLDGKIKTILYYSQGKLKEPIQLYDNNGQLKKR